MEFKSIDSLSITECCEHLSINWQDLPNIVEQIDVTNQRDVLLLEHLKNLLEEDKMFFQNCSTISEHENYLSTWTDGLWREQAQTEIARLKARLKAEAEELDFYNKNKDSISGCEAYLKKYPKGKFVKEIQSILIQKKKSRKNRNILILLLYLILVGIFVYSNYVPVSYVNVEDNAELNNLGNEISLNISTDANSSTISATSSEDWINCRVSGNTLYISGNTNPKNERSATITITAHSMFFGSELSKSQSTTITVVQKTGYATRLSISNDDIYLSANGGKESVTIDTDGIFAVSTVPASWVTASVNGKTLQLEYGENSGIVRNSYLIIKSGSKTKRLNISQAGKSATRLDVSTTNISFNADGGSKTIEIYTDGECKISTQPESWTQATINGNSISLRVVENSGTKRTGYFVIKSGTYEKRINISQAGKSATRLSVSTESVSFSSIGGRKTINVSTDGEWKISTGTNSWGHTSINGNTITLRVDANDGDSRTDYFIVKSGAKEKRINIYQEAAPKATDLRLEDYEITVSKDGSGEGMCYPIDYYTDGTKIKVESSASWISCSVTSDVIQIEVSRNYGSKRSADVIVKSDNLRKTITVNQRGTSHTCPNCNGNGRIMCVQCAGMGGFGYGWSYTQCWYCHGAGGYKCFHCGGSGIVE